MTNILAMNNDGTLTEVAHTSATKAIVVASDGTLTEVAATGTVMCVQMNTDGSLQEVSIVFSGAVSTVMVPTPTWTF